MIELSALKHLGKIYGARGNSTTNCVRFAKDVLEDTFGWELDHKAMMLDGTGPWANIEHLVDEGLAREVLLPKPGAWHYVQAWRKLGPDGSPIRASRGHCWLWYEGEDNRTCAPSYILEATPGTYRWYRTEDWLNKIDHYDVVRLVVLPECD